MTIAAGAATQEQFLDVVSKEEAVARFRAAYPPRPLAPETVTLDAALGRVLAADVASPVDVPPFDRSMVDGLAVVASDTVGASDAAPRRLRLNSPVVACGHPPGSDADVAPGTATVVATGAMIPRGADAVVMVEWADPDGAGGIDIRKAAAAGQAIAFAGSDIARGETILRRGTRLGSREIGMLAACGVAAVTVVRQPIVGVISTGDELVAPGEALPPAAVYDSNSSIVAATVAENGGIPRRYGVIRDDEPALVDAVTRAVADCDMVVLSGGTSKGAGDVSHRVIANLGQPGIVVHGVALKPGKPLVLAVARGKPIAVLPGFPTSAIFTFRTFVVPVLRAMAGLPAEDDAEVQANLPLRLPSELGRTEFAMVTLTQGPHGLSAYPTAKGSGAVTSFSQADGFIEIPALADGVGPNAQVTVRLLERTVTTPDLVITGSHCVGLDAVLGSYLATGRTARTVAIGSLGGVAALKRHECDLAPVHLMDPATGAYNTHLVTPGLRIVPGWRRRQAIAFRPGDVRFEGRTAEEAVTAVLADPTAVMVNRNAGAGTRVLIDRLLGPARPRGWTNQPRSHNAVAAAIAQGRADWGVTLESVATSYGLGIIPLQDEHYDFMLAESAMERPAVRAFLDVLATDEVRDRLLAMGFVR